MLSLRYREQLAEAFRAVDAGTITKTRERMDRRDNQRRDCHRERSPHGWLAVIAFALAVGVVCWMTRRPL